MQIRPIESGLLMILESIRALEEDRAPGKSRYIALADQDVFKRGEALLAIVSIATGIELLLKQLIIEHNQQLLAKGLSSTDPTEITKMPFSRCVQCIADTTRYRFTLEATTFLTELMRTRNKAVHTGIIDREKALSLTSRAVRFVMEEYFSNNFTPGKLTREEDHILTRIRLTAKEFDLLTDQLNQETEVLLIGRRRKEFLWFCSMCDHQSMLLRLEKGSCLRCKYETSDSFEIVSEACMEERYCYNDRQFTSGEIYESLCNGTITHGITLTEPPQDEVYYCCGGCGSFYSKSKHSARCFPAIGS